MILDNSIIAYFHKLQAFSFAAGAGEVSSLYSIQYMQDMTTGICAEAKVNDTTILEDKRDHKKYWVAKLADNNCWMVQNLDLDLTTSGLTSELSDMNTDWNGNSTYKPVATQAGVAPSFTTGVNDVLSWDPGIQICNAAGCNVPTGGDYDTHYTTGNYYSWIAATAGAGNSSVTSGSVTQSICPKKWTLPINGGYNTLFTSYGVYKSSTLFYGDQNITTEPLYFVYGGYVNSSTLYVAGSVGYYWSSTANTASSAYGLYFSTSVAPSYNWYRYDGFSVRCVAR